jgi:hypothetical protein
MHVNRENQLWLWFGSVERHLKQNITATKLSKKKKVYFVFELRFNVQTEKVPYLEQIS